MRYPLSAVRLALSAVLAVVALHMQTIQADPLPPVVCGVPVEVPDSLASPPFDIPRTLCLPPGFSISVVARIPQARFLAATPDGGLLVSQPSTGNVLLVDPQADPDSNVSLFADGSYLPHDMVFHAIGDQMFLYVAGADAVVRFPWNPGDRTAHDGEFVIRGLPIASNIELGGAYAHPLKSIAIDSQDPAVRRHRVGLGPPGRYSGRSIRQSACL